MEDFEAIAREREKEITARREQGILDPRDEKGLIKVEDHKHLGRDPESNAIVNTDRAAYFNAFSRILYLVFAMHYF